MESESRYRAACLCLDATAPTNCDASTLGDILSRLQPTSLSIFRSISELTRAEASEVLACISVKGCQGFSAAVRICVTLRRSVGAWETISEIVTADCPIRDLALLAVTFGKRARYSRDWSHCIQESLNGNDEAILTMAALLERRGFEMDSSRILELGGSPVTDWESQKTFVENPSLARELSWCFFTAQCQLAIESTISCSCNELMIPDNCEEGGWLGEASPDNPALNEKYFRMFGVLIKKRSCNLSPEDMDVSMGTTDNIDFAVTNSVRQTFRQFANILPSCEPILLQGPQGCGKSALVSRLAHITCSGDNARRVLNGNVCFIHMDTASNKEDSSEFSSLVGCVVPLPEGGGFRWRFGPIGHAVVNGSWLILENMDCDYQSGNSFTSALVSRLAELRPGDEFSVPSRSEPLRVGNGFRLVATRTVKATEQGSTEQWTPPGGWKKWNRIVVPSLTFEEQLSMLNLRFPAVVDCVPRVLKAVSGVSEKIKQRGRALDREPSFREAVRISSRLVVARTDTSDAFSSEVALLETIDVLAAWASDTALKEELIGSCADSWSLSMSMAVLMLKTRNPGLIEMGTKVRVGRTTLWKIPSSMHFDSSRKLALTKHTARTLERIARCVSVGENVLLNGETGTGKTSTLQELARLTCKNLVVINMSRQSDISDLIGGYRPMEIASLLPDLVIRFEEAFCKHMSSKKNARFLDALHNSARTPRQHGRAIRLMRGAINAIPSSVRNSTDENLSSWNCIDKMVSKLEKILPQANNTRISMEVEQPPRKRQRNCTSEESDRSNIAENKGHRKMSFEFSDGVLVSALRAGDWVLLDEINLAPVEVLDHLISLLDHKSIIIPNEEGETVLASDGFALFAAMNPPTDFGKRPLSKEIRSRMTEVFVDDLEDKEDIEVLVAGRLFQVDCTRQDSRQLSVYEARVSRDVAEFYLSVRDLSRTGAVDDASGKCARFSLRTLTYMLSFAAKLWKYMGPRSGAERRALYEGAVLAFATPLPRSSRHMVLKLAQSHILQSKAKKKLRQLASEMRLPKSSNSIVVSGFPIETHPAFKQGAMEVEKFIVTSSVQETLVDVCRALVFGMDRVPILLQGPTSAGKTSLVSYLAQLTGNKLIRINNHEHTDLAEYLGCYVADTNGSLVFREGPLVQAARKGHWVVLDELNLAPPEVLESLNRLLDDNREIRIPETGAVVKAHKNFTLFATQNPPGVYAGRKELSRAFRGRFIEIQVDELPDGDLIEIIERRCRLPSSFAKQMVGVMRELQTRRRVSRLFSGKSGFVTARDLFRWGARRPTSREELALHGFFLLGERSRNDLERSVVRDVIATKIGIAPELLNDARLYGSLSSGQYFASTEESEMNISNESIVTCMERLNIAVTPHMSRMVTLLMYCICNNEPALLVGPTGTGKTSAISLLAGVMCAELLAVNCHQHTESSDLVGGYRPSRTPEKGEALFEWVDGPLVYAMKTGQCFLMDEINMSDDAVVERLNAVLETSRTLVIPEKASEDNTIVGHQKFRLFATMNPGGDFGKKELSPALRNRFTEIWIPHASSVENFIPIIRNRIRMSADDIKNGQLKNAQEAVQNVLVWIAKLVDNGNGLPNGQVAESNKNGNVPLLSLRDVTAWTNFISQATKVCGMHPMIAYAHGARLVFLDGMSVGASTASQRDAEIKLWTRILEEVPEELKQVANGASFENINTPASAPADCNELRFGPFALSFSGKEQKSHDSFCNTAPCTLRNSARVVRAVCVDFRPVLLEGPPGAGKTSLIIALAKKLGIPLSRINLSESTEISDLIGCDAPGERAGEFRFRKGELLRALEGGHWVLLDEMNLASQSVLEGLNSLLDHRRSVFVPELSSAVTAHPKFRLFAAQNPAREGCGRRGLPRSFLNRFTKVTIEAPTILDLNLIAQATYPSLKKDDIAKVVSTLHKLKLHFDTRQTTHKTAEYGLRQVLRWCDLMNVTRMTKVEDPLSLQLVSPDPQFCFDIVVLQALTNDEDQEAAKQIFCEVFNQSEFVQPKRPSIRLVNNNNVRVGCCTAPVHNHLTYSSLYGALPFVNEMYSSSLQAMAVAMKNGWPCIIKSVSNQISHSKQCVTLLASLFGRKLFTVKGGSFLDVDDLLGSYVQRDVQDEAKFQYRQILDNINEALCKCLKNKTTVSSAMCDSLMNSEKTLLGLARKRSVVGQNKDREFTVADIKCMADIVHGLCDTGLVEASSAIVIIERLTFVQSQMLNKGSRIPPVFLWQKSELVCAIEKGDWVVIEDADQCSPAVLDRLNPLLERPTDTDRGEIIHEPILLPEAPLNPDGSPAFISTHPQFRLCFIVNESHGSKLSRAIIDRSVSICLRHDIFLSTDVSTSFGFQESPQTRRCMCCLGLQTDPKSIDGTILLHQTMLSQNIKMRGVLGFLHTGVADFLERYEEALRVRDISVLYRLTKLPLDENLYSFDDLLVLPPKVFEKVLNRMAVVTEGDANASSVRLRFRRLLTYALTELYMLGSTSSEDFNARREFLLSCVKTFSFNSESVVQRVAFITDQEKSHHSSQKRLDICLDPIYGLDSNLDLVQGPFTKNRFARSIVFRFDILIIAKLCGEWSVLIDDCNARLLEENSLFSVSKRQEFFPLESCQYQSAQDLLGFIAFRTGSYLVQIANCLQNTVQERAGFVEDWTILNEVTWLSLFEVAEIFVKFLRKPCKTPEEAAYGLCLLQEIETLCSIVRNGFLVKSEKTLDSLFTFLESFLELRPKFEHVQPSVATPRNEFGFEMEHDIWQKYREGNCDSNSVLLAQALVSITASPLADNVTFRLAMEKLSALLPQKAVDDAANMSCSWEESAKFLSWEHVLDCSVEKKGFELCATLQDSVANQVHEQDHAAIRIIARKCVLEFSVNPHAPLSILIPAQRLSWLLSSEHQISSQINMLINETSTYALKFACSKLIDELKHRSPQYLYCTCVGSDMVSNSLSSFYHVSSGELKQVANSGVAAALALISGELGSFDEVTKAQAEQLKFIYASLLDLGLGRGDRSDDMNIANIETCDEKWFLIAKMICAQLQESNLLNSLRMGESFNAALSNIHSLLESVEGHTDHFLFTRICGLLWTIVGASRIERSSSEIDTFLGLDPSMIAKARSSIIVSRAEKSIAFETACMATSMIKLGGDDFNSSLALRRAEHASDILCNQVNSRRSDLIVRPKGFLSFGDFVNVANKIPEFVSEKSLISRFLKMDVSLMSSNETSMLKDHLLEIASTLYETSCASLDSGGELGHFRDVGGSLCRGIREIQYGSMLFLKSLLVRLVDEDQGQAKLKDFFTDLFVFPAAAFPNMCDASHIIRRFDCIDVSPKTQAQVLIYLFYHGLYQKKEIQPAFSYGFANFVNAWKTKMIKNEAEDHMNSSLFIMKQKVNIDSLPGMAELHQLEEDEEKDFEMNFNVDMQEIDELVSGDTTVEPDSISYQSHDEPSRSYSECQTSSVLDSSEFWLYHALCFHSTSMNDEEVQTEKERILLQLLRSFGSIAKEICVQQNDSTNSLGILAACALSSVSKRGNHEQPSCHSSSRTVSYNFYKDRNESEVAKLRLAVKSFLAAVQGIQRSFFNEDGNHPILSHVCDTAARTLKTTYLSASLGALVSVLENLIRKADEWQRLFASKSMSLSTEISELSKIALRWRRMEVDSWPSLLIRREETCKKRAHKWFYYLYDSLIGTQNGYCSDDDYIRLSVSTLDQFLRSAPRGEFEERLKMLRSISCQLCMSDKLSQVKLGNVVFGLCEFYSQYSSKIEDSLKSGKEPLEKKMNDFVRLSTWHGNERLGGSMKAAKGVNKELEYFRLKSHSEKVRRRLHKLCREADTVLNGSVFEDIAREIKRSGFSELSSQYIEGQTPQRSQQGEVPNDPLAFIVAREFQSFENPSLGLLEDNTMFSTDSWLAKVNKLSSRMKSLENKRSKISLVRKAGYSCSMLRDTIRERALHLRHSEAEVQVKKRALVELLKALEKAGVAPYDDPARKTREQPAFWLGCQSPFSSDVTSRTANALFYKCGDRVQRLRAVSDARVRNADITTVESKKTTSFCSDLFIRAVLEREHLSDAVSSLRDVKCMVSQMLDFDFLSIENCPTRKQVNVLANILNRVKSIQMDVLFSLRFAEEELSKAEKISKVETKNDKAEKYASFSVKRNFQRAVESISVLKNVHDQMSSFIASYSVKAVLQFAHRQLHIVGSSLLSSYVETLKLLRQLQSKLNSQLSVAQNIAGGSLTSSILRPIVHFLQSAVKIEELRPKDKKNRESSASSDSVQAGEERLLNSCNTAIEHLLLSVQGIIGNLSQDNGISKNNPSSDDEASIPEKIFGKSHRLICVSSKISGLSKLKKVLIGICEQRALENPTRRVVLAVRSLARLVARFLNSFAIPFARAASTTHLQTLGLLKTLTSLFIGISEEGYCRPPEDDGERQNNDLPTNVDGAGFGDIEDGDASMAKDVSAEVEDEEQILGIREEKQNEENNGTDESAEPDTGIEMQTDFEGDLENIDKPDADDENENDPDNKPDIDESMGQEPDDSAADIDERLWDQKDTPSGEPEAQREDDQDQVQSGSRNMDSTLTPRDNQSDHRTKPESGNELSQELEGNQSEKESNEDLDVGSTLDEENPKDTDIPGEDNPEQSSRPQKPKLPEDNFSVDEKEKGEAEDEKGEESGSDLNDSGHPSKLDDSNVEAEASDEEIEKDHVMKGLETNLDVGNNPDADPSDVEEEDGPNGMNDNVLDGLGDIDIDDDSEGSVALGDKPDDIEMEDSLSQDMQPDNGSIKSAEDPDPVLGPEESQGMDPRTEELSTDSSEQHNNTSGDNPVSTSTNTTPGSRRNDKLDPNALISSNPQSVEASHHTNCEIETDGNQLDGGGVESSEAVSSADQSGSNTRETDASLSVENFEPVSAMHDVNPFRSVEEDDIGNQWEDRLRLLEDLTRDSKGNDDSNVGDSMTKEEHQGLYEFMQDENKASENKTALGAATDEQHKSLQKETSEINNDAEEKSVDHRDHPVPAENVDFQAPKPLEQGPTGPPLVSKNKNKEGDPSKEVDMDTDQNTAESLKVHPLLKAMRLLEDMRIETDNRKSLHCHVGGEFTNEDHDVELLSVENEPIGKTGPQIWNQKTDFIAIWRRLKDMVEAEASVLSEQLRLVLDPTIRTGLAGSFKTGKRLDMKKVIDFVASDFRRDRIWLRRVRPTKRSYDVLIAIDNSESMSESGAGALALAGLVLLVTALGKLEVGRVGVLKFGAYCDVVRGLIDSVIMDEMQGSAILSQFSFDERQTNLPVLLETSQNILRMSKGSTSDEDVQLLFIISDGKLSDREQLRRRLRQMASENVLVAFIVVNNNATEKSNIFQVKQVSYGHNGEVRVSPYMSNFPFQFYTVIHDASLLPSVLGNALRQWLELMADNRQ